MRVLLHLRFGQDRIKSLVELRYSRMLDSPFTFYRGNALLQAHDLAATSSMGLVSPICGDSHLMNFGGFATPERNLLFSVNDFDEAYPDPWEWDLKRRVASFVVAARDLRHGDTVEETVCRQVVGAYQQTMLECAEQSAMETWYESISYRDLRQQASKATLEHVERAIGYIGKSDALADALFKYAQSYTAQNERDFEQFQQACRKGRLRARSEADFAADHLP